MQAIAAQLYADRPTRELFHYTSLEGMMGIASSKSLWASEIGFLNDAQELRHFGTLMANFAQSCPANNPFERDVIEQLLSWLSLRFANGPLIFTTSFTENGNLLSQWRGYCPHGLGVSLGFPPDLVVTGAESANFSIGRCVYDPTRQMEVARMMVLALLDVCRVCGPDKDKHPTQSHWTSFEKHEATVVRIAALMKHPSFAEEDEWRCVSPPITNYVEAPIKYRTGQSSLIPF